MKKIIKALLGAASVFGVGASGMAASTVNADAKTFAELRQEADEACEEALRKGTIEALEEYLWKYPWASNACRAKAQAALGEFDRGDYQNDKLDRGDGPPVGY